MCFKTIIAAILVALTVPVAWAKECTRPPDEVVALALAVGGSPFLQRPSRADYRADYDEAEARQCSGGCGIPVWHSLGKDEFLQLQAIDIEDVKNRTEIPDFTAIGFTEMYRLDPACAYLKTQLQSSKYDNIREANISAAQELAEIQNKEEGPAPPSIIARPYWIGYSREVERVPLRSESEEIVEEPEEPSCLIVLLARPGRWCSVEGSVLHERLKASVRERENEARKNDAIGDLLILNE